MARARFLRPRQRQRVRTTGAWAAHRFLERQLQPQEPELPAPIAAEIDALEVTHADPQRWLADVNAQYKVINAMPDGAGQGAGPQDTQ